MFIDLSAQLDKVVQRINTENEASLLRRLSAISFGNLLQRDSNDLDEEQADNDSTVFDLENRCGFPLETPGFHDIKDDSVDEIDKIEWETENNSNSRPLTTCEDWDEGPGESQGMSKKDTILNKSGKDYSGLQHNLRSEVNIVVVSSRETEPKYLYHQMVYFLYKLTPVMHEGPVLVYDEGFTDIPLESAVGFRILSGNLVSSLGQPWCSLSEAFLENLKAGESGLAKSSLSQAWWNSLLGESGSQSANQRKVITMLANLLESNIHGGRGQRNPFVVGVDCE